MTLPDLLSMLRGAPLVASVQASPGSPLADPRVLLASAQASLGAGARVLRLQGVDVIQTIQTATAAPTIGLIKREYGGSDVYITPTAGEVESLLATGCEVVALDATTRPRPGGATFAELAGRVHAAGRLVMADCDTIETATAAAHAGADLIGTTLAGYTAARAATEGPDFEFLRQVVYETNKPVIAEGRYAEPWEVATALRIGAAAVVVGGALNDPVKQTRRLAPRVTRGAVGAIDIGGTWIRYGVFSPEGRLVDSVREPLPQRREERLDWIRAHAHGIERLGVSSGGCIDPATGLVWKAKPIIPDHEGTVFHEGTLGVPTVALNDGLATAWGHACLPEFAGRRVATLALGTGVGFGLVDRGRVFAGQRGEPPHLNDLVTTSGATIEELLGGAALQGDASAGAQQAFDAALSTVTRLLHPEVVVVCGGVGLAPWLEPREAIRTPHGADAGLFGAAALALYA